MKMMSKKMVWKRPAVEKKSMTARGGIYGDHHGDGTPVNSQADQSLDCVIKIIAFANGTPCPIAGQYLKEFDPEADDGRGSVIATQLLSEAMVFPDFGTAFAFWKQSPKCKPLRSDGKPNRPLTASTVVIVLVEKEKEDPS